MHDEQDLAGTINRRGFLGTGASALAVASAVGIGQATAAPDRSQGNAIGGAAQAHAGQDRRRGQHAEPRHMEKRRSRSNSALLVGQRHPVYRHGQELRVRAGYRTLVSGDARSSQADFLVTKDHPQTPKLLIKQLDERLKDLQTDYVDLIFIHHLGDIELQKRGRMAAEQRIQRDGRRDPEVGQGQARWLFDPPSQSRSDLAQCRRRRICRRHHGPE